MGKLRQLSPESWPLIVVILFSYIELILRGGVSCLPAALLFTLASMCRQTIMVFVTIHGSCVTIHKFYLRHYLL